MKPLVPASLLLFVGLAAAQAPDQDWKKALEAKQSEFGEAKLAPEPALAPVAPSAPAAALAPGQSSKPEAGKKAKSVMTAPTGSLPAATITSAPPASAYPPPGMPPLLAAPSEERNKLDKLSTLNQLDAQEFSRKMRPINEARDEATARYNEAAEKARLAMQVRELEMRNLQMDGSLFDEKKKRDMAALRAEIERMQIEASLADERRKKELAAQRAEIERMRLDNERAGVALESERLKSEGENLKISHELRSLDLQSRKLKAEVELAEHRTVALKTDLDLRAKKAEWKKEANREPEYPLEPFKNGVLTISDRRIPLKGPIIYGTADYITERIDYFNNKDSEKPIYIVIDRSPGGSVMEGYRILKAMQTSKAPVHVVVKQFAASMAATIASLAPKSYAYPNAIILHHQMWSISWGNPTQQKQQLENMNEWNRRLLSPVAKRMGLTLEGLTKKMYERNVDGDWEEFADKAVALKWIDHITEEIRETGTLKDPEIKPTEKPHLMFGLAEESDSKGERFVRLPHLQAYDAYFLYNRDGYYR